MIEITHIKWDGYKIGVALHKLKKGNNRIKITAKDKNGNRYYPKAYVVDKDTLIDKYGVSVINKNSLLGVWIPLREIENEMV